MSLTTSAHWMYNAGDNFYGYAIDNSLRFNDNDSAYLNRTPSSTGNRRTWTFSCWFKRGNLGINVNFFNPHNGGNESQLRIRSDGKIQLYDSGGLPLNNITNAVFRDTNAWYHLVVRVDTTQATGSNRVRIYVNSELQAVTSGGYGSAIPSQNYSTEWNLNCLHTIGKTAYNSSGYFDGYIAEINHVDGQSLAPTEFGETKSGIWIPKEYSGSYGTNGFHLDFGNSSALGTDVSGNNNNFSLNNIFSHDQVSDSPTNNWSVLERLQQRASYGMPTLSEGNLKFGSAGISSSWGYRASNMEFSSGKYYAECRVSGNTYAMVGVFNTGFYGESHFLDQNPQNNTGGWMIYHDGASATYSKFNGTTGNATITDFNGNGIVGLELDADNGTVKFYVNGSLQTGLGSGGTVNISAGTGDAFRFWSLNPNGSGTSFIWNFGQDGTFAGTTTAGNNADENGLGNFKYSPSSGYLAPCSSNLPAPTFDNAEDETPEDYFNTVLYTGNNATTHSITGVGFQPDFVWGKIRSANNNHWAADGLRGVSNPTGGRYYILPNSNNTEVTNTSKIKAFGSDGFSVGSSDQMFNANNETYVAWCWKGSNSSGSSNTDGTITTTVNANTDAGFSIVKYVGNGSGYIGHGLGVTPDFFFIKNLDNGSYNWNAWHNSFTGSQVIYPNLANARNNDGNVWAGTLPTSTRIRVNNVEVNASGNEHIAYCFANKEGYCKVGTYIGNGSSDGVFIYTGFRPAWILLKNLSSGTDWMIQDNRRLGFNVDNNDLVLNQSYAEATDDRLDQVSNGFKFRSTFSTTNTNGHTYMYVALAHQPFKYANAR